MAKARIDKSDQRQLRMLHRRAVADIQDHESCRLLIVGFVKSAWCVDMDITDRATAERACSAVLTVLGERALSATIDAITDFGTSCRAM